MTKRHYICYTKMGDDMEKVLEIKNVSKTIKKRKILDNVSFDINKGEIFGLVGPNGAGKTTLIKVMLGLYKSDKGSIIISGYDVKKDFEKAMSEIGAIIENPELYNYLSGIDNLNLYSRLRNNDPKYKHEIIKLVKLEDRINNKVKTYSLGMRQRLGIAQALISKPNLLILDEPINGLDPLGIKELRELLIKQSKENGMAVFISSHILNEMELLFDKIAIIDEGKIIEIKDMNKKEEQKTIIFKIDNPEKAKEILEDNSILSTTNDKDIEVKITENEIANLNKILVKNDINVYRIEQKQNKFEDEFVEKTTGTKGQIK